MQFGIWSSHTQPRPSLSRSASFVAREHPRARSRSSSAVDGGTRIVGDIAAGRGSHAARSRRRRIGQPPRNAGSDWSLGSFVTPPTTSAIVTERRSMDCVSHGRIPEDRCRTHQLRQVLLCPSSAATPASSRENCSSMAATIRSCSGMGGKGIGSRFRDFAWPSLVTPTPLHPTSR